MALVKPIAQGVSAFDATQDKTFSFTSNGGSQVVANRITIRLQSDNSVVYQNKVTSYRFEQTVPSGTLKNDNYYNFYFNTFDSEGNMSEDSNVVQFYCYSEPTFSFTNLPLNNLVENSSYTFKVIYNQTEGELLNYVKFYLYNSLGQTVDESGLYYDNIQIPIYFSHTFGGFDNNANYEVEAIATTVNGMTVSTGKYAFNVRYYHPQLFNLLDLENNCEKGYVNIKSNVSVADGEVSPEFDPPIYLDSLDASNTQDYVHWDIPFTYEENQAISLWLTPSALDVHQYGNWVKWSKGFNIKQNFTFTSFMKVGRLGEFALIGTRQNGFVLSLVREIPYSETEVKDKIVVDGYVNGVRKVHQESNYVDILNQKSKYMVWFRKRGDYYDTRLEVLNRGIDILDWDVKDIELERLTDKRYVDEDYKSGEEFVAQADDMSSVFPLFDLMLWNGIYDFTDITGNVLREFNTNQNPYDYDTFIQCNFDGNISGSNANVLLSQLKYARIKRRKKDTFKWVTLNQYKITSIEDLNSILMQDYFVPTDYDAEYAIVPVLDGDVEGDYVINSIKTKFTNVTIADADTAFSFRGNITYNNNTKNSPMAIYTPLKGKYAIIEKNSELDYWSGSITLLVLGYNFDKTKRIDRADVVKETNDLCEFLNNTTAKIIKDWNGNIHMVRFTGSPTVSYNSSYGNGIAQVTANWVEQGQFDNQNDLYYNGLTDVLS